MTENTVSEIERMVVTRIFVLPQLEMEKAFVR